ncbi:GcvT family protein [Leucobacter sp. CSA1]|uniref:GcvT family protein n=1 Tax=Leucobacter chromiisoli TaxID=2796471 RepID=A0A934UTN9_9MICO|nr:FAD-dependent oxidoreductase [Leucobacter chromiisoli]MBK0417561.1 GcvT family protein [Leucobacter chromiisoli]
MERLVDRSISASLFTDTSRDALPQRARTVIVGGGIVGASTAYHLALAGETDVLLLDSGVLGSGTTWHAAGLANRVRATETLTGLSMYGTSVFQRLEELSGIEVNWQRSGSFALARTRGRLDELHYQRNVAAQLGIEAELVGPDAITSIWPLINPAGVRVGLHIPDDGHVNPGFAAIAFAKLAHEHGAAIREDVRVTELLASGGRITGVRTEQGDVEAERVVLAAGLWSRDLGRTVGAALPLYAAEHVHVRSNPIAGVEPGLPVLRDLDHHYYARHERGRLLIGAFEPEGLPRGAHEIPSGGFAEFDADWEHFDAIRVHAERTLPAVQRAGYDRFLNAPESFTPDANFLLGETNEVAGLFVAAGMNSQGITYAPGVGRELAAWILEGTPQFDASSVDVRRFSRHQANRRYLHERTSEGLGRVYATHWPNLQMSSARNVRRTPLHARLAELGAVFGEANALERANWYVDPGATPEIEYSYGRASWFERVGEEHRAVRENLGIFDLSPFAKFEVAGPDALAVVQRTFTSNLDVEPHRAVYTLQLNEAGGIELDCTVTRLAPDRFMVVSPSATQDKTLSILRRAAEGAAAAVFDATAAYATILVAGPRSRELMQLVSPEDWSDGAQPYLHGREVEIADGFAYALRVSFVGEMGYELYVSSDLAVNVFDALWEAGRGLGARLAGYYALDSMRAEKGFRHLGHDMGPADDPRSAGLWFTVDLEKGDFLGRDAIADLTPADITHRTVYFRIDDPEPVLVHDETVFRDGVAVGRVLSGNYGYTLGGAVGLAAIDPSVDVASGAWEVECGAGGHYPATVSRRPLYDPKGERMRG